MMGYVLLWIENLAVSLLLVALVLACVGRLRRRWLRHALWMPAALVPLLAYAGILVSLAALPSYHIRVAANWVYVMLTLIVSFVVGTLWLRIHGLRRLDVGPTSTLAGSWPRGKLAIALGVALALHLMTFWNLDLAARQQAEALRTEAGVLALSVAPPRIPDRDNAAIVYERILDGLLPLQPQEDVILKRLDKLPPPNEQSIDFKDPEVRSLLQKHAHKLIALREVVAKPGCYFEHDYQRPSYMMRLPEVNRILVAAKLLDLDAHVKVADGDIRGAIQDINTLFAMSQHVSTEPFLCCLLTTFYIEQRATEAIQSLLISRNISADDLGRLRIDDAPSHWNALERALRFDEAVRLMIFCEVGRGDLGLPSLVSEITWLTPGKSFPKDNPALDTISNCAYRLFLFAGDLSFHRRLSQQLYRIARKPYSESKQLLKDFEDQFRQGEPGLLTSLFMPWVNYEGVVQADALHQALRLGLAAEQYRLRHGKFPVRLDDLVPDFIPAVPFDPFDGKPMRMKRSKHNIIVYSIGPDMVANGGVPFDREKRTGDITFELSDGKR